MLSAYDNNKQTTTEEKESVFRNTWAKTFRISEEENQTFDRDNDTLVNQFINENQNRIKPYETANLSRLDSNNPLTKPFTKPGNNKYNL